MSIEPTPAAAAETPAPTPIEQAISEVDAKTPAPEAETQDTQPPAAETQGEDHGMPKAENEAPEKEEDESTKRNKVTARERIAQLSAQRNEANARAQSAEAELERLRKQLEPPGPDASQDEVDRWNVKAAVRESRAEEVAQNLEAAKREANQARFSTFSAKAEAVADRIPGLVEQFCALPVVSDQVADFVAESDKGAEVAFFLTQNNGAEAARISRLSPYNQGKELARIEARLTAAPTVRKVTTAPPPPPSLPGRSNPAQPDPANMDMASYEKWRAGGGGR